MPINGVKGADVSFSFRLQEALSRLVKDKKITIPSTVESDGSLVVTLKDQNALDEKTKVFTVNRSPEAEKLFTDYKDAPVLTLIKKVYGKDNVEVDKDAKTLTVRSQSIPEDISDKGAHTQALYFTEFHNARQEQASRSK